MLLDKLVLEFINDNLLGFYQSIPYYFEIIFLWKINIINFIHSTSKKILCDSGA